MGIFPSRHFKAEDIYVAYEHKKDAEMSLLPR